MFSEFSLHDRLVKAINTQGYEQPTPVQSAVIPDAIAGKDVVVSAETGSGKTAAFLLPILHQFMQQRSPCGGIRALILVPTRELAQQVFKNCNQLADFTPIKASLVIGGVGFQYQIAELRKNPELVIATPGRLLEHLDKASTDLKELEVLVIDEADRMFDMGFAEDVLRVAEYCNQDRQTMLFSATLSQKGLSRMIDKTLREPIVHEVNTVRDGNANIRQQVVLGDDVSHKSKVVNALLEKQPFDKALVFVNTKVQADSLAGYLRVKEHKVGSLHSDMEQAARKRTMELLRRGTINVLVATDVASRGLDVKGIDLVINFDMARSGDDYIHRIGRTGRAGEQGTAISLVCHYEWNLTAGIQRYLRTKFEFIEVEGLVANFKGPKKTKSSGKAVGIKNKKAAKKKKAAAKGKERHRDTKNVGKRRSRPKSDSTTSDKKVDAGMAIPKRKPTA